MSDAPTVDRALSRLAEDSPSYQELIDLYNTLRTAPCESSTERLCQHALAQVVGEVIDYLDWVAEDFEKSVGLTRAEERRRVLDELAPPPGRDRAEQVSDVIEQWRSTRRYGRDDVVAEHLELSTLRQDS